MLLSAENFYPSTGPTSSKLLRKISGRFLILLKSQENIWQSTNLELGNNDAIIIVLNTFIFTSCLKLLRFYVTMFRELVSRAKLCLVSVFPDIVKDCPTIRNLPEIFLRSFENVGPDQLHFTTSGLDVHLPDDVVLVVMWTLSDKLTIEPQTLQIQQVCRLCSETKTHT